MSWQLIGLADVLPTPWRNGGGGPPARAAWATPQGWGWRAARDGRDLQVVCCVHRGGLDRLQRRHAGLHHQDELIGVVAVG